MVNSRKGGGKSYAGNGNDNLPKGNKIGGSGSGQGGSKLDQLNRDIAGVSIDPAEQGEWEVIGKKSKNRLPSDPKQWGSSTSAPPKVWGQSDGLPKQGYGTNGGAGKSGGSNWSHANDSRRSVGRGNPKPQLPNRSRESAYMAPPAIHPPLKNGWQWAARGGSSGSQWKDGENISSATSWEGFVGKNGSEPDTETKIPESDSDGDEMLEDSDDDLSDCYESDSSQKSHGTRKKNRWFKGFFEALDKLTIEEISEQTRQWHCPACHNGPGAIDWYKGLQPLIAHAKTKGATRVKLHRELAEVLDEELRRRGTSVIPAGESFGKWKGLRDTSIDHEIVWPPMVIIMNTQLEQDENDKWLGMGNQELLDYFPYQAVRARHSYGPHGHRGMSLLIFEANAVGYLEAERLHKHFSEEGKDKDAWERRRVLFGPGGKRRLYGYLASKEDIDAFNKHCHGKSRLKYEMKSYQEMVVIPMKQMSEDNQQLTYLKKKVVKHEQRSKVLEESFGVVSQKLRETMEENRIVRLRTKIQHEENREEMDYQEQFFKEQIEKVHNAIEEKERVYEKLLQEERAKAKQFELNSGTNGDILIRREQASRFIDSQVKGVEEFEAEREKLVRAHQEKKAELRHKFLEDEVELEKELDAALTKLMEKHVPSKFPSSS